MRSFLINWLNLKSNDKCLHMGQRTVEDHLTMEAKIRVMQPQGTPRATRRWKRQGRILP